MGRHRKPRKLKIVAGTDQPCRRNENEPRVTEERPETPIELTEEEAEKFDQLCNILAKMGILGAEDVHKISLLARTLHRIDRFEAVIQMQGDTYVTPKGELKVHPFIASIQASTRIASKMLSEFGLDPVSRAKVSAVTKEMENPFAAFLG